MCFEVGRVDHDRRFIALICSQINHHLGKDAILDLTLPAPIKGLMSAIFGRRVPLPRKPLRLVKMVLLGTRHLRIRQPT